LGRRYRRPINCLITLQFNLENMKTVSRYLFSLIFLTLFFPILVSAQSEKKTGLAILIDNTGSMRGQLDNSLLLAKAVVENSGEKDFISVFHFETQSSGRNSFAAVTSKMEWNQNKNAVGSYIDNLWIVPGQTTLYDAIDFIAKITNAKAEAEKFTEKRIVLITDGEDRASKIKQTQLIEKLKEDSFKVYAFGLVEDLEGQGGFIGSSQQGKSSDFLKKITKETGGNVVFPKRKEKKFVTDLVKELFAN